MNSSSAESNQTLACSIFSGLPNKLCKDNFQVFIEACRYVDELCSDSSAFRLLMPFHRLTFGWQSAYGKGFTWELFFDEILNNKCVYVSYKESQFGPALYFSDNADSNDASFSICMVHND